MKVVITRRIPGPAIDLLQKAGHEVVVFSEDRVQTPEELKQFVVGADALLSLLTDKIDGSVMDAAGKQLKIIANYAVGFDNIDLTAAKQRNIYVTNTPGGFECAVAEHTLGLMLSVARNIVSSDRFVREGKYHQWEPDIFIGLELKGKTLGIIGLGRIGLEVAKAAKLGFGMKISYFGHQKNASLDPALEAEFVDNLDTLLQNADIVSLHVPLCAETTHLISRKQLSEMKKSSLLINTARGPVVDELALIEALKNHWIAGAGLDVFEDEVNIDLAHTGVTVNPELLVLPNVVLTPHIASATIEARCEMSRLAAENILAALSGKVPENLAK